MVELCRPRSSAAERKGKRVYLRIGNRIVNTDAMTDAEIVEVQEGERTVLVRATAVESRMHDRSLASRRITLSGEDAELFLAALPTYSPALEPGPQVEKEG